MSLEKYIIPLLKTKNIERNYDLKCTKNRCTNSNSHYYECRSKFNRTKYKTLKSCFEQSYIYSTRGWSGLVRKYFEIKNYLYPWLTDKIFQFNNVFVNFSFTSLQLNGRCRRSSQSVSIPNLIWKSISVLFKHM